MEDKFEKLVADALDHVPKIYAEKIKDVVFKIEDEPSPNQRQELGLRDCDALFGLYQGVPLTRRNGAVHAKVPDVITVFRHPMMDIYKNEEELEAQIYETIWHEIAHYFGLDHQMIHSAKNKPQSKN